MSIKNLLQKIRILDMSYFFDLFWPTLCIQCQEPISSKKILCAPCLSELTTINPLSRCPRCFSDEIDNVGKICSSCSEKKPTVDYVASVFDYLGPAKKLVHELKYHDRPYLAKSLGSYLFLQFLELQWPEPDYIISVPQSFSRFLDRGYNQSELLAKEVSKLLQKPYVKMLKKTEVSISQAKLTLKERQKLQAHSFSVLQPELVQDKVILLIDDVYTTGTTLECCAKSLQEYHPHRLYALTLCRS
ncbi:MAG: comF [Chlamydiia bacterium]|nr:comF [Chlamydiia bacterium]